MSLARKVAFTTIVQIIGRVVGLLVMLVTINYLANHLIVDGSAQTGFGQYTIVFTWVSVIGVIADFGLYSLLVRDISGKPKEQVADYIGSAIGFRLVLMILVMAVLGAAYFVLPYDSTVRLGIILGGLMAFSLLFTQAIAAILQANLATDRIVLAEIIARLCIVAGVIGVLQAGYGLLAVILVHLVGYLVGLLLTYLLALRYAPVPIRFNVRLWRETYPQFWPVAMVTLLSVIHFKIDALMLSFYRPAAEVGIYGIAYKLFEIAIIVSSIFATNMLPVITRYYDAGHHARFQHMVRRSSSLLVGLALLVTLIIFAYAPWFIAFVSQAEFIAAAQPLRILIIGLASVYIADLMVQGMISARYQRRLIWAYLLAIPLNIILNSYAIPHFSYTGAAVTTVITEAILVLAMLFTASRSITFRFEWAMIGRSLGAVLLAGGVTYGVYASVVPSLAEFLELTKLTQAAWLVVGSGVVTVLYVVSLWIFSGLSLPRLAQFVRLQGDTEV